MLTLDYTLNIWLQMEFLTQNCVYISDLNWLHFFLNKEINKT